MGSFYNVVERKHLEHGSLTRENVRKVWVSIRFLSAKFGLPPPPNGPKLSKMRKKLYKSVEHLQN